MLTALPTKDHVDVFSYSSVLQPALIHFKTCTILFGLISQTVFVLRQSDSHVNNTMSRQPNCLCLKCRQLGQCFKKHAFGSK